jgi:hypothetical protein
MARRAGRQVRRYICTHRAHPRGSTRPSGPFPLGALSDRQTTRQSLNCIRLLIHPQPCHACAKICLVEADLARSLYIQIRKSAKVEASTGSVGCCSVSTIRASHLQGDSRKHVLVLIRPESAQ